MSGSVAAGDAVEDDDEDDVVTVKCPPQRIYSPSLQIDSGILKYWYILHFRLNSECNSLSLVSCCWTYWWEPFLWEPQSDCLFSQFLWSPRPRPWPGRGSLGASKAPNDRKSPLSSNYLSADPRRDERETMDDVNSVWNKGADMEGKGDCEWAAAWLRRYMDYFIKET